MPLPLTRYPPYGVFAFLTSQPPSQAVILVAASGEVSVLSIHTLSNLLGSGRVTGWSVTPASNEQFFMLEVGRQAETRGLHAALNNGGAKGYSFSPKGRGAGEAFPLSRTC